MNNQFGKLNVKRDIEEEVDDQGEFQKDIRKDQNLPVMNNTNINKNQLVCMLCFLFEYLN